MIKINIFLAIYTYHIDIDRYHLTEKIFKHYKNIQEKFKFLALFTFKILGSENTISQNLSLKYFKPEEYFEFDQSQESFEKDFYKMLGTKINVGINKSLLNDPDILLWGGSNDYISFDFFEQIINYYKPDVPQIYGIDNYQNGKNAVFFTHFCGAKCLDNQPSITDNPNLSYWWDGVSNYYNREKFQYSGGILGINKNCFNLYPDILSVWSFDEGAIEEFILKKQNIDKFNSKNIFYMNIKSLSKNDITTYDTLKILNINNMLNFHNFSYEFQEKFREEFNYFINSL